MIGGKRTPRKDKGIKVSSGQLVKEGEILVRNLGTYKAGINVSGVNTMHALCDGKIYFSHKKMGKSRTRTYVNIEAIKKDKN